MNSKEKVLSVYPDAHPYKRRDAKDDILAWIIASDHTWGHSTLGRGDTEAEAWNSAASQLPSAPSPAGETASEDWFPYPVAAPIAPAAVSCIDCGRPYPHGLDFVLTWKQWTAINPEGYGVLCPNCMVNRAAKIPGVISIYGCIVVNEDLDPTGTLESMIAALRLENSDYCRISREQARVIEQRHPHDCRCSDCGNVWISNGEPVGCPNCKGSGTVSYQPSAKPSAEGDGWIAEREFLCSLLPELDAVERRAQAVDRQSFRRDGLRLSLAVRKVSDRIIKRAELPAPPSGQGEVR